MSSNISTLGTLFVGSSSPQFNSTANEIIKRNDSVFFITSPFIPEDEVLSCASFFIELLDFRQCDSHHRLGYWVVVYFSTEYSNVEYR